ncbi:MAG: hypothetical protein AAFZ05_05015 [Pseudomonadota bacterium]
MSGHNRADAAQWQTPHLPEGAHPHEHPAVISDEQKDIDLVEMAFVEGFATAEDPVSFLRLSGIPFTATAGDGARLQLVRVEQVRRTDVASLTPHLGGETYRHAPLPKSLVSQRNALGFVYFDGQGLRELSFEEARELTADA